MIDTVSALQCHDKGVQHFILFYFKFKAYVTHINMTRQTFVVKQLLAHSLY